jgi:Deoxyhypusine synthase
MFNEDRFVSDPCFKLSRRRQENLQGERGEDVSATTVLGILNNFHRDSDFFFHSSRSNFRNSHSKRFFICLQMDSRELQDSTRQAVLMPSESLPESSTKVRGFDFSRDINYEELLRTYKTSGFQATNFGRAVEEINKLLELRDVPLDDDDKDAYEEDDFIRRKNNCTVFFGFTSNMVSSGLRETLRFLVQHKLVDCIVTSAGKKRYKKSSQS